MIVTELDLVRVAVFEPKADPPLVVHGDRMLSDAVASERVESIPRRHAEVTQLGGGVDGVELSQRASCNVRRYSLRFASAEEFFGLWVGE